MVSKESKLLVATTHEAIYNRFAPGQKRLIVFHVSLMGLLSLFVEATFVPSIPQVAKDLNLTHAVVSLAFSLTIFSNAIGGLVWTAYASFYGRQSIYLWGMPFLCVGSCGLALCTSLQGLLFWRFVQTFGCAGAFSVGIGVIGDIYKLEERGTATGIFIAVTLLGNAIAPFIGGAATQYWSWRNFHYCIGTWCLLGMLFVCLSLPETSHPSTLSSLLLLRSPNLFAVVSVFTL
ncbi:MFS general substrate transporter [Suillus decipiens]|nr:MFS general substrate transporter [Suillus decipiens]